MRALRDFCQAASDLAFENLVVGIGIESGLPQYEPDAPDQKEALSIIRDMRKYDISPNVDIVMGVLRDRFNRSDEQIILQGACNAATSRIDALGKEKGDADKRLI